MAQAPLTLSTVIENTSCEGACDGRVTVYPSGGVAPYTYSWSNGETKQVASKVCYGSIQVVVTDASSGSAQTIVHVDQNFGLDVTMFASDDTGFCDADALAVLSNGVAPFTYTWSNGVTKVAANNGTNNGVCSGTHHVLVTDANGCTAKESVNIPLVIVPFAPPTSTGQSNFIAPPTNNGNIAGATKKPPTPMASHSSYPNPFTTKSTIQVVPEKQLSNVQVQVYDMRGLMVADLHQGPMYQGQVYEMNFIPENQPTGVFIYKIISGDGVETGKMFMQ